LEPSSSARAKRGLIEIRMTRDMGAKRARWD
jgi:hypothetical protein